MSFKLVLQKMGALMVEITFKNKSHHTLSVSNTTFDTAKFLEMAEQILGKYTARGK